MTSSRYEHVVYARYQPLRITTRSGKTVLEMAMVAYRVDTKGLCRGIAPITRSQLPRRHLRRGAHARLENTRVDENVGSQDLAYCHYDNSVSYTDQAGSAL